MSSIAQPAQPVTVRVTDSYRWLQLLVGIVCMAMIANLQYGWTLFVNPLDAKYHWGRASIQVAFTIFVLLETWLVPIEGYLVDRYGPRLVVLAGGILCGIAWAMNAYADSLTFLRSEEHTSELQSPCNLVCRLLLEKKKSGTAGGLSLPRYACVLQN